MRKRFDRADTLSPKRGRRAGPLAEVEGGLCLRLVASALIISLMLILLNVFNIPKANSYPLKREQQDWVLVAMNHLADLVETQCWVELIWRESTFNPAAVNGSHYGLAQMKNPLVKKLSPRQQVKMHMKYLDHRYPGANGKGSACKALKHLKVRGWH